MSDRTELRKKLILPTVGISLMTVVSAVASLNVAIPSIARDTGASQSELTWIVDSYTVVFAGLLMLAGAIGDRYGRRLTLTIGLTVFGLASIAGLSLTDPQHLILVRIAMGLGAAFIMPSTLSVITTAFDKEERTKAVAIWVGIAGGGAFIGIFATAFLLIYFNWNSIFGLNVALAAIGLAMTLAFIPESRIAEVVRLDWLGGIYSIVAVSGIVAGIIMVPEEGWSSPLTYGSFIAGIAFILLFVFHELRTEHPLLDPRVFKERKLAAGSMAITIQFFCQFGFIFIAMQYLQYVVGFEPWEAAEHLLPIPFFLMPSARIAAHISKKVPQKYMGSAGLTLFAGGMYVLSRLTNSGWNYSLFLVGLGMFAVGAAFSVMPATTAITSSLPTEKQGVASAINDTARELGSALGIAILGTALNNTYRDGMKPFLAQAPAQYQDFILRSPAFTQLTPPQGFEAQFAKLVHAAINAFGDGSSAALLIASGVGLAGALFIVIVAPRTIHD